MVDLTNQPPNKSLEVKEKQAAKQLDEDGKGSSDQFKDLSKTSAKSSYPEVVTEPSHQVNLISTIHLLLTNFPGNSWRYGLQG